MNLVERLKEELIGKRFSMLVVTGIGSSKCQRRRWVCLCDCGNTTEVFAQNLRSGGTKSCGCVGNITHGETVGGNSKTYSVWVEMLRRCNDTKNRSYSRYGGIGVTVCEEWHSFEQFLSDMGKKPDGMSIERIDVNLGYSPSNCKWIPLSHQNNNKRNTLRLTIDNNTKTLVEWALISNIKYQSLLRTFKKQGAECAERRIIEALK